MKKNTDIKTLSDKLFSAQRVVLFPHENPDGDSTGACTALTNGVAIPHCRFAPLKEMRAAIGVHSVGLDCGSVDGMPSRIFILVLASPEQPGVHLKFLGEITRRLLRPEIRENILIATSPDAVRRLLSL